MAQANQPELATPASLTIEEKRKVLYVALLRHLPEAKPLRDQALERVILGALIGSSVEDPYRIGDIQTNLKISSSAPEIRVPVIKETLERLVENNKVEHTLLLQRHAYYLSPQENERLSRAISSAEDLFNSALKRLLKGTGHLVDFETGAVVCRSFIYECFARFGKQIAKSLTGQMSQDELVRTTSTKTAFSVACQNKQLSAQAVEYLEAKCVAFLKSTDPEDQRFKFHLTQGYYVAQLLGLDDAGFNPLAEHSFKDSVFYLDTNVLLTRIVTTGGTAALFDEMIRVAKRLGIHLCVTRATINEARRAAAIRTDELKKVIGKVPEALLHRTRDQFLNAFVEAQEQKPDLTVEEFMQPFDRLSTILELELGITIVDKVEEEMIRSRDFTKVDSVIKEEAERIRGRGKTQVVTDHDVSHYALIADERMTNPRAWFLTNDRSLVEAGIKLSTDRQSFCFSLIGLLQSISPFITTAEEKSFVDIFSALLTEQVLPTESMYDMQDLVLLADLHDDVQSTPPEKLVEAYEYVKDKVFHGHPVRPTDLPKVALGLRKFLTSRTDEQKRTLEIETERLRLEIEKEREQKEAAKNAGAIIEGHHLALKTELEKISGEREHERASTLAERSMREAAEEQLRQHSKENTLLRGELDQFRNSDKEKSKQILDINFRQDRNRMIAGFVLGLLLWLFSNSLIQAIINRLPMLGKAEKHIAAGLTYFSFLIFCLPALHFIRTVSWKDEFKIIFLVVVVSAGFAFSHVLDDSTASAWSSYIEIATAIAIGTVYWRSHKNNNTDG